MSDQTRTDCSHVINNHMEYKENVVQKPLRTFLVNSPRVDPINEASVKGNRALATLARKLMDLTDMGIGYEEVYAY